MNFMRKSTTGFSIGNILLDFLGGVTNYAQMAVQSIDQSVYSFFFFFFGGGVILPVESGFMRDANLILLSLPDSWVNFYGNIGKTLLSLVWNISSILDNSSTLCKFLTVTNLMLVVWFYHYCQIICCPSKPVLSFTFHLNSSLLPSALVLMDTFCRCPYSLTLYSCVNTISCTLRRKLFLPNSTRREQSHLSGVLRSQLRQKMCKVKLI